ncbi:Putative mannose-6-phosphate receptor binding domain superfamily, MRH domain, protein OS-9 [Septoria linicola]|uniref:Endoplasmic reticulum lectin n=1 Tax=Septoria linicola TaxID=215465 RepID=A0A9Q9EF02_9PEZI|nr:putative mannose-6-phosphate receptor binding domain superfamily, MRH domain, protein OS-9 [Septoria linicola]USW47102.1 Putative mannose-6-phosphate receptor binding domain superfamily, MRH domain, protein OS-9 [Septoria linicola]
MKHFLALPALLRTSALLALASQHSFSVQDDLLAFPQYEVRFVDEWTHADHVQSKLDSDSKGGNTQSTDREREPTRDTQIGHYQQPLGDASATDDAPEQEYQHEHMMLDGQPWLCRIPKVKAQPTGTPANETLSKTEEDKELTRAHDRGWELLSEMEGNCVFFISGWWSYRFCYNQGIKQFHQLPPSRGVPVYPPVEDPGVPGYMLGTYAKRLDADEASRERDWDGQSALEKSEGAKRRHSKHGELVQRGESRYLVQKLGGGTVCDLTGKERKIEVQFHCSPQAADRIALIKETSTCAYLMVIQTPRLCNDVAFLPPQKDQPNSIACSPVLREEEVEDYERDLKAVKAAEQETKIWEATAEAAAALGGGGAAFEAPVLPVGDIYVGEHRLVPEGVKIEKSAIVGGGKETYVDTLADSEGRIMSKEDLEKLGLSDPKQIEKLKKELEKIAQGQTWKLDVIDTPRGREYRGIIGDDEEEGKTEGQKEAVTKQTKGYTGQPEETQKDRKKKSDQTKQSKDSKQDPDEVRGSEEEFFRDEL